MPKKTIKQKSPRKAKKFRSQVLAYWLTQKYLPCKVADIGGGKGLLTYLLGQAGWDSTVIDPEDQALPEKYTNLEKKKVKIKPEETVKRVTAPFAKEMGQDYNLLLGLHAHGSMMWIIEAALEYNLDFLIIPCCVIDEPIVKKEDVNWRESLYEYALSLGLPVKKVQYNFMGKNIALYTDRNLTPNPAFNETDFRKLLISPIKYEACEREDIKDD